MSRLPDDVQFSLHTPSEVMEEAIANSLAHIQLEVQHTQRILEQACSTSDVGVGHHGMMEGKSAGPETSRTERMEVDSGEEKLQRLRESFREERSKTGSCRLKGDIAAPLRTKLLELQEKTDGAVALLSEMQSSA